MTPQAKWPHRLAAALVLALLSSQAGADPASAYRPAPGTPPVTEVMMR